MFGVSTAWNYRRHNNARSMIEEIKKLGVDAVELNFKLSKETVDDIAELADKNFVKVLSLHNFCPVPDSIEISKASPDYYSLASLDTAERKRAIAETRRTMDTACRLKARAIVVHSGRLDIKDRTRELAKAVEDGLNVADLIDSMHEERERALKKGYLERLLESIKELLGYSKKTDIKIGFENRFYFRELPSIEDFSAIFTAFEDPNICYWHDTGHAQVYENLKLLRHAEYLEKFGHRLLGVHLHDVRGVIDDHNAPFTGDVDPFDYASLDETRDGSRDGEPVEPQGRPRVVRQAHDASNDAELSRSTNEVRRGVDFSLLKPFLNTKIIKILEPHEPAGAEDIKTAIERLRKLYGE